MQRPRVRQWGRLVEGTDGGGRRCRGGASEDVASETAKITSLSARRRSPAWRRAVAFCNGSSKEELVQFSSVAI
jgi:hypothetical protein